MQSHTGVAAPARCVPCLRMFAATLYVAYDGRKVRSRDPRGAGRDRAAELQAARVLEGLGALELASLEDCAVTPGSGIDYVLAVDGDAHALCAFGAHALPQLRAMGWQVEIDPDYPWQIVASDAALYVAAEAEPERPDWFGLELGIEIEGQRVSLLPALLELLDGAGDLAALARSSRRYIAVRVDAKRWLPVPPARLRLLGKVLLEMYRDGTRREAPAPALARCRRRARRRHGPRQDAANDRARPAREAARPARPPGDDRHADVVDRRLATRDREVRAVAVGRDPSRARASREGRPARDARRDHHELSTRRA